MVEEPWKKWKRRLLLQERGIKNGYKIESSMMQFDIASTIATIFDIKQPQVWIGRSMDVFQ